MTRVKRILIFFLAFPLITNAVPASLQKNSPFAATRKMLLKEKWKPINVHAHDDYVLMGVEHELAKMNINEFESCSIDSSSCLMRYKRGSECLTVFTIGEKVKYMRVINWNNECPSPSSSGAHKTHP